MRKVVVITGASAGIGAALAKRLGRAGHSLVLAARRSDDLARTAAEASPTCISVVTDVSRRSDVDRLRDRALQAFGRVDVWINNAGRGSTKSVLALTDEDIDDMMLVNLKSALYGMQAIVPHFQERNAGHLINVSSFLARVPLASIRSAYSASKAALNSLTANLRMDLRATHPGIAVSVVMPGLVATEFAMNATNAAGHSPTSPRPASPAGPVLGAAPPQTAEDVADAIVNLIAHPSAEIFTNPAQAPVAARYTADVGAFEAQLLMPR